MKAEEPCAGHCGDGWENGKNINKTTNIMASNSDSPPNSKNSCDSFLEAI